MAEPTDNPYEVGEEASGPGGSGSRWPACCALVLALGVAFSLWCVWFWTQRVRPKLDQTTCAMRLKDVQIGASIYAERTGAYPYTGQGFDATFALMERSGDFHMGYQPSCPFEPGHTGYGAPFSSRLLSTNLMAWCESKHPGGRVIVTADGSVDVVDEARFRELKARYDERVARLLGPQPNPTPPSPRSPGGR
tara:strand:+ start:63 stop:641 length:579 start_codon:yes stop_codon:yes gene_type:complete